MNRSGDTVGALLKQVPVDDLIKRLIVIHDDIDLPRGRIKITSRGGAGGHRGVESVAHALGTDAFVRFKIGIVPIDENGEMRKPRGERAVTDYVLRSYPCLSKQLNKEIGPAVVNAVRVLVSDGIDKAMSYFNSPPDASAEHGE
jgi:PTH1 family peptidyl-tRNA hydrolase